MALALVVAAVVEEGELGAGDIRAPEAPRRGW